MSNAKLIYKLMAYQNTLANEEAELIDETITALEHADRMREALKTGKAMGLFHSDAESSVTHRDLCKLVDELLEKDNEQA